MLIKNRPRQVIFNVAHPAIGIEPSATRAPITLGLELAYLIPTEGDAELYERVLDYVTALNV